MKEFTVRITEILQMDVTVMAESEQEAEEVVESKWKNSDYVLDASHFEGAEFKVVEDE